MSSDLWTCEQLASHLGISRRGLTNMIARGEIPGVIRIGKQTIRISRPAIVKWLHGTEAAADDEATS